MFVVKLVRKDTEMAWVSILLPSFLLILCGLSEAEVRVFSVQDGKISEVLQLSFSLEQVHRLGVEPSITCGVC